MMKKTLLALAVAVATLGTASAHPLRTTHYHDGNRVVIGNAIAPKVDVRYETDRLDRRVKVTTTVTCVDTRVNRRNNHLRCVEEDTEVTREIERPRNQPPASIEPRVQRHIERDADGRRYIVTITDTCTRPAWQNGQEVCYRWERDIDRQPVRWNRDRNRLDLDGDGRTNPWEALLYQGFRDALEN